MNLTNGQQAAIRIMGEFGRADIGPRTSPGKAQVHRRTINVLVAKGLAKEWDVRGVFVLTEYGRTIYETLNVLDGAKEKYGWR